SANRAADTRRQIAEQGPDATPRFSSAGFARATLEEESEGAVEAPSDRDAPLSASLPTSLRSYEYSSSAPRCDLARCRQSPAPPTWGACPTAPCRSCRGRRR